MLLSEGITPDGMTFAQDETFIFEEDGNIKGFYTVGMDHNIFPHLRHFLVDRPFRNGRMRIARSLIKHFRAILKEKGYRMAYVHAKDSDIGRLIQWYFKVEPKEIKNNYTFYLIEV